MSFARLGLEAERPATRGQFEVVPQTPHLPTAFDQLGLTPELLRSVAAQGYTDPTPVQAQSIPIVLAGRDLLASAQTGTGKTAAFVLPILQLLNATRPSPRPAGPGQQRLRGATGLPIRCLVLTPTRELALQIEESVRTYGAAKPVRSTTIYGGVGFQPQVVALKHGPEIVVATPGRLLDHAGRATIDLSSVEILVLDEADRMLDMGFIHDIRRVLALLPARRQNLLFSATFSDEIRELAGGLLDNPAEVQVARRNAAIELVRQVVHPVDRERKRELLSHLIRSGRIDRALVFARTKHGANRLAEQLGQDGIRASAIHGNKSQSQRVAALSDFKAGRVAILVATEIAARGLDIDGLPHVVNYEMPSVPEDYIHRIGRTGRAGLEGDAVSLVCVDEAGLLDEIQRLLRHTIDREVVPGFEVDRSIRPDKIKGLGRSFQPTSGFRAAVPRFPNRTQSQSFAPRAGQQPEPQRYAEAPRNGRPAARPDGPRPNAWRPNDGRPMAPRPMAPRPMDQRANGPRPNEWRPNDVRPSGPRPMAPRPMAPRPMDQRANGPRPNDDRRDFQRTNGQRPNDPRPVAVPYVPRRYAEAIRPTGQRPANGQRQPVPFRPAQPSNRSVSPGTGARPGPRRDRFESLPGERFDRRDDR